MKVALVYDRINKWGGAERILLSLHEVWPNAPLYTGVYNRHTVQWAEEFDIRPTFVQKFPLAKTKHEFYPWLLTVGFETLNLDEYDIVISVTSAEAKGVITKPNTLHICYCLTPTRYLWSHKYIYLQSKGRVFRTIAAPVLSYLRSWDQIAASRPDYYLSISKHVQKRVKKYYQRESEVIYPPVDVKWEMRREKKDLTTYYLVVSRLVPYKRVDIAIKAANKLKLPLVIVGEGSEKKKLQKIAGDNIKFVSGLTDRQLLRYYQDCRALIVSQEEDFGLAAIEVQACGKPVLAYKRGGALETVIEGKTGEFFGQQTVESLVQVLERFKPQKYVSDDCIKNARRFSKEEFKRKFRKYVEEKYKQHFEKFKMLRN